MAGVAVAPDSRPEMHRSLVAAVDEAGGTVVELSEADALVWADPDAADRYPEIIAAAPNVEWIQLPYAGIEPFAAHLDTEHVWTCGKGVYAEPVAEWIVTALLTAFRDIPRYVRATSWPTQGGRNLLGAHLTVIGAGGITRSLLRLLEPWKCEITVVRRSPGEVAGAHRTFTVDRLHEAVTGADAVVVACSLTAETTGIVDADLLAAMADDGWLLNVARGAHVRTADLVDALERGIIAGAVLDVTDPEPLPDDSALWALDNCVITPHVGNTPEMGLPLLADRVRDNVTRWLAAEPLIGVIDIEAGY